MIFILHAQLRVLLLALEMKARGVVCLVIILCMKKPDRRQPLDVRTTPDREPREDVKDRCRESSLLHKHHLRLVNPQTSVNTLGLLPNPAKLLQTAGVPSAVTGLSHGMFEDDDVFEDMPDASGAAVSEQDWSLIRQFNRKLDEAQLETCNEERFPDFSLVPLAQSPRRSVRFLPLNIISCLHSHAVPF